MSTKSNNIEDDVIIRESIEFIEKKWKELQRKRELVEGQEALDIHIKESINTYENEIYNKLKATLIDSNIEPNFSYSINLNGKKIPLRRLTRIVKKASSYSDLIGEESSLEEIVDNINSNILTKTELTKKLEDEKIIIKGSDANATEKMGTYFSYVKNIINEYERGLLQDIIESNDFEDNSQKHNAIERTLQEIINNHQVECKLDKPFSFKGKKPPKVGIYKQANGGMPDVLFFSKDKKNIYLDFCNKRVNNAMEGNQFAEHAAVIIHCLSEQNFNPGAEFDETLIESIKTLFAKKEGQANLFILADEMVASGKFDEYKETLHLNFFQAFSPTKLIKEDKDKFELDDVEFNETNQFMKNMQATMNLKAQLILNDIAKDDTLDPETGNPIKKTNEIIAELISTNTDFGSNDENSNSDNFSSINSFLENIDNIGKFFKSTNNLNLELDIESNDALKLILNSFLKKSIEKKDKIEDLDEFHVYFFDELEQFKKDIEIDEITNGKLDDMIEEIFENNKGDLNSLKENINDTINKTENIESNILELLEIKDKKIDYDVVKNLMEGKSKDDKNMTLFFTKYSSNIANKNAILIISYDIIKKSNKNDKEKLEEYISLNELIKDGFLVVNSRDESNTITLAIKNEIKRLNDVLGISEELDIEKKKGQENKLISLLKDMKYDKEITTDVFDKIIKKNGLDEDDRPIYVIKDDVKLSELLNILGKNTSEKIEKFKNKYSLLYQKFEDYEKSIENTEIEPYKSILMSWEPSTPTSYDDICEWYEENSTTNGHTSNKETNRT